MLTGKEIAEQNARKLLDVFMSEEGPDDEYVVGFAHALLLVGVITPERWKEVTDWAQDRQ